MDSNGDSQRWAKDFPDEPVQRRRTQSNDGQLSRPRTAGGKASESIALLWYGEHVKRSRVIALAVALVLIAMWLVLWNPWDPCDAPASVCEKFDEIQELNGVASVELEYEVTSADPKDGDQATATWTIRLSEDPVASEAAAAALRAERITQGISLPGVTLNHYSQFTIGKPQVINTGATTGKYYPLSILPREDLGAELKQAYEFRDAGALRVTNSSVVAADSQSLKTLAELAVQQNYLVSFEAEDRSVRYTPDATIDLEKLELVIDAGALQDVGSAIYGSQSLSIHTTSPDSSVETRAIQGWLEQRTPPNNEPLKYSISSPGFAKIVDGWIGEVLPAALIPSPAPLPEGVEPWTRDPDASYCTTEAVRFTLSAPDAALGSRYLSVFATNVSNQPCAVQGLAAIEFFNGLGESQEDVTIIATPTISPELVLIPAGETAMSTMKWAAMSTANDPDETESLEVSLFPGLEPVKLIPRIDGQDTTLDVLDGAEVEVSPWVQALEGWNKPT